MFAFLRHKLRQWMTDLATPSAHTLQASVQTAHALVEQSLAQTTHTLSQLAQRLHIPLTPPQWEALLPLLAPQSVGDVTLHPNYAHYFRPEDVFLLAYPYAGAEWVRAIVAHLLYPEQTFSSWQDLQTALPDVHLGLPPSTHPLSQPRVFCHHQVYYLRFGGANPALYKRFIYVLRHPYAVAHSHYRAQLAQPSPLSFADIIEAIAYNAYSHGAWAYHLLSWHRMSREAHTLFLRYEDCKTQPIPAVQHLARFFGYQLSETKALALYTRALPLLATLTYDDQLAHLHTDLATVPAPVLHLYARYSQPYLHRWGYLEDGTVAPLTHLPAFVLEQPL